MPPDAREKPHPVLTKLGDAFGCFFERKEALIHKTRREALLGETLN